MFRFVVIALVSTLSCAAFGLSDSYEGLSAVQKQDLLWKNIAENPYPKLPAMVFFPPEKWKVAHGYEVAHAASDLGKSFDHVSDEMPEGRVKIIHAYGSAARVEFVPATGHPFTGLFKSGALGIVRLSLGTPHGSTGSFVPGMGLKLLVDDNPSRNMHVMQRLEGQDDDRDFFKHTFTNKLPEPTSRATKIGRAYFGRFVDNPIFLRVDHVANIRSDGRPDSGNAPYQIFFQPAEGLHLDSKAADFREELAKLAPGIKLYDVYGTINMYSQRPIYIGSLVLRSAFVASEYGDKKLYFRHEGTLRRSFWLGRRLPTAAAEACHNCPGVQ